MKTEQWLTTNGNSIIAAINRVLAATNSTNRRAGTGALHR